MKEGHVVVLHSISFSAIRKIDLRPSHGSRSKGNPLELYSFPLNTIAESSALFSDVDFLRQKLLQQYHSDHTHGRDTNVKGQENIVITVLTSR